MQTRRFICTNYVVFAFSYISREATRRATQLGAILSKFQYDISVLDLFREEKDVCVSGIFQRGAGQGRALPRQ